MTAPEESPARPITRGVRIALAVTIVAAWLWCIPVGVETFKRSRTYPVPELSDLRVVEGVWDSCTQLFGRSALDLGAPIAFGKLSALWLKGHEGPFRVPLVHCGSEYKLVRRHYPAMRLEVWVPPPTETPEEDFIVYGLLVDGERVLTPEITIRGEQRKRSALAPLGVMCALIPLVLTLLFRRELLGARTDTRGSAA